MSEDTGHYIKSRIKITESGCWEWTGPRDGGGYGWAYAKGKQIKAHRLSYQYYVRELKPGEQVCHKCDNPPCCNPDHLFAGTSRDNALDKVAKGRHCAMRTEYTRLLHLDEAQKELGRLIDELGSAGRAARLMGISEASFSLMMTGKRKAQGWIKYSGIHPLHYGLGLRLSVTDTDSEVKRLLDLYGSLDAVSHVTGLSKSCLTAYKNKYFRARAWIRLVGR